MPLSRSASTPDGPVCAATDGTHGIADLRMETDGTAGLRVVPEPSPAMTAVVADLLWPTALTPALRHDEVRGRLLGLLHRLLAVQRSLVLQWEHAPTSSPEPPSHHAPAAYTVWRADAAGTLHSGGKAVPAPAMPLPLVAAQGGGVLIACPQESGAVDPAVARLLGPAPALLLPLAGAAWGAGAGILALSMDAMPREGELTLALAFARRAAAVLSGAPGADRALPSGGRAARRFAAHTGQTASVQMLSPREREIVQLVAAGLRNKEIARRLKISEKTVKFHLGRIFDKMGVDSRTEVLLRALAAGLHGPGYPGSESADPAPPAG